MKQFNGSVSCNYIQKREDDFCGFIAQHSKHGDEDNSYPFGFFWIIEKKSGNEWMKDFYIGEENSLHDDIENELLTSWADENSVAPWDAKKLTAIGYRCRGRVWLDAKAFAFDQNKDGNPDKETFKYILSELEQEIGGSFDDFKIYISDCEDPRTPTDNWKLVNEYSVREYITGIADDEKEIDAANKKNISDFVRGKYAGEKAYSDFQTNDPRADRMYKDFVSEHKNRKHMKTLVLNERQCRLLKIDECINQILNEASYKDGEIIGSQYGKCIVILKVDKNNPKGAAAARANAAGVPCFMINNQIFKASDFTKKNITVPQDKTTAPAAKSSTQTKASTVQTASKSAAQTGKTPSLVTGTKPKDVKYLQRLNVPVDVIPNIPNNIPMINLSDRTKAANYAMEHGWAGFYYNKGGKWEFDYIRQHDTDRKNNATQYQSLINKGVAIAQKLVRLGFNETMAIAIAANLWIESDSTYDPFKGGGYRGHAEGLCQWLGQRKYEFAYWAGLQYPKIYPKIKKLSAEQIKTANWENYTIFPEKKLTNDTMTNIELRFLDYEITHIIDKAGNWKNGLTLGGKTSETDLLNLLVTDFEANFEKADGKYLNKRKLHAKEISDAYYGTNTK